MDLVEDARALFDEVNELLNEWDPIGVVETQRDAGIPLNEYRGYAPGIASLLMSGISPTALAEHLSRIITENIGLSSTSEQQLPTARKLCDWYQRRVSASASGR